MNHLDFRINYVKGVKLMSSPKILYCFCLTVLVRGNMIFNIDLQFLLLDIKSTKYSKIVLALINAQLANLVSLEVDVFIFSK